MTDFLELLLDLPQEEEEMSLELHLPTEGRRPDTVDERTQMLGPGEAAEGTPLSAGPVQRTALVQGEAPVRAGVSPHGELRVRQTEESSGTVQRQSTEELHVRRAVPAVRWPGGNAGLPDRAVEAARDALARGAAFTLPQQKGTGRYAQTDAAGYSRSTSGEFSSGGAAALARRLAQSGARPTAVRSSDEAHVTAEAGTDLEELDRRVRRDARRYDGALTLY